jgi:hypothetical protein
MDGTFNDEYLFRAGQSKKLGSTLYKSQLTPMDSYMVYETCYRPALQYPLRVTTFSKSELQDIQRPFIFLLLPKIGLNRHIPRAVVYGPLFRGGLGLVNLEEQQIIQHFHAFQGHLRRNDDIGKSIRIQLSTHQLEIGCGEFFLNTLPSQFNYGTINTRLTYLWRQCACFNITVSVADAWIPSGPLGRHQTIMDYAVNCPHLRGNMRKLSLINSCRLYLHLMWPQDLTITASSSKIDMRYISGAHINDNGDLCFPSQGMPSIYAWSLWKAFIYKNFCLVKSDANKKAILFLIEECVSTCMTILDNSDFIMITNSLNVQMTLAQKFTNLPDIYKQIIGNITIPDDDGLGVIQALQSGTAIAASDGSYLEEARKGSHAYKIMDKNNLSATIFGASMCPASDKMSSSPAEHYGAIGILLVLIVLLHHFDALDTKLPSLVLLIDNEEAVNRGNRLKPLFLNIGRYLTHDFDLWNLLSHL